MKLKAYEIEYGNGVMGSTSNMGTIVVIAPNVKTAHELMIKKYDIKRSWIGRAYDMRALSE